MALSKLNLQQNDREKLYYNKYGFRGIFKTSGLFYARNVKDITRYRVIINETKDFTYNWRGKVNPDLINYDLVEKIIEFRESHMDTSSMFRHEDDKLAVFTNDPRILEKIAEIQPDAELTQLILSPAGTKYFKIDPPAKYRVYLKNRRIDGNVRDNLLEFFSRDLAKPCMALRDAIKGKNSWRWTFIKSDYHIDYDDETTLSYMGLMFSDLLGKTYKLEKKEG